MAEKKKDAVLEEQQEVAIEQEAAKAEPEKEDPIGIPGTAITESQLKALKKQYKRIFVTDYIGKRYVWHRIGRKAFADICDATEEIKDDAELIAEREKRFCEECVIYPDAESVAEDVDNDVVAYKLSQEILYRSGFMPPETKEA